jgi:hypothetical protein
VDGVRLLEVIVFKVIDPVNILAVTISNLECAESHAISLYDKGNNIDPVVEILFVTGSNLAILSPPIDWVPFRMKTQPFPQANRKLDVENDDTSYEVYA